MKVQKLNHMTQGWFVGDFLPSIHKNKEMEVAVKKYCKGDQEAPHYHKIATEITVMINGRAQFNDLIIEEGEIVIVQPNEVIKFEALDDCSTVVVKFPSLTNDKYVV